MTQCERTVPGRQREGRARRLLGAGLCATALVALSACGAPTVPYSLVFPSEETFLLAETARVDVYDGTGTGRESPDAICRALSIGQPAPVSTLASTGKRAVCEFLDSPGLPLEVATGKLVLFAEAEAADGTKLLRGCSVVNVLGEGDEVKVQLSTLPTYPEAPAPACPNRQSKCGEGSC